MSQFVHPPKSNTKAISFKSFGALCARVERKAGFVFPAIVLTLTGLWHLYVLYSSSMPDFREGAMTYTTALMLEGRNPWSIEEAPLSVNVYGAVYHLAVLPLALLFGPSIFVHRLVSGLMVWIGAWLIWREAGKLSAGTGTRISLAAVYWSAQIYYVSGHARPDSTGVLFFLLAFISIMRHGSFFLPAVFAILAWLTKPYFLLVFPLVFIVSIVERRWRDAVLFTVWSAGLMLIAVVILRIKAPLYFSYTLFIHQNVASYSLGYAVKQAMVFGIVFLPLMIISMRNFRSQDSRSLALLSAFCLSSFIVLIKLAPHYGNFLTYLLHLMLPLLLLLVVHNSRRTGVSMAAALSGLMMLAYAIEPVPAQQKQGYQKMLDAVEGKKALVSAQLAAYFVENDLNIHDSGHTEYYRNIKVPSPNLSLLSPADSVTGIIWQRYKTALQDSLRNKVFDVIVFPSFVFRVEEVEPFYMPIDSAIAGFSKKERVTLVRYIRRP